MLKQSLSVGSWNDRSESERYESETNAIENRSTTSGSSRRRDGEELPAGQPAVAAGDSIETHRPLRRARHSSVAHHRRCGQQVRAGATVRGASLDSTDDRCKSAAASKRCARSINCRDAEIAETQRSQRAMISTLWSLPPSRALRPLRSLRSLRSLRFPRTRTGSATADSAAVARPSRHRNRRFSA